MPYLRASARFFEGLRSMQNLFQEFCAQGFNPGSYKIELVRERQLKMQNAKLKIKVKIFNNNFIHNFSVASFLTFNF